MIFLFFRIFSGNAILTLKSKDNVKVITVRGTSFAPAEESGSAKTEPAPSADLKSSTSEFVSQELVKSDRPELASAKVVVSGGKLKSHIFQLYVKVLSLKEPFLLCRKRIKVRRKL